MGYNSCFLNESHLAIRIYKVVKEDNKGNKRRLKRDVAIVEANSKIKH
jgi:hypothetical protein